MPKFRVHARVEYDTSDQPTTSWGSPVIATVFGFVVDVKNKDNALAAAITDVHGPNGLIAKRFGHDYHANTTLVHEPSELIEIKGAS